MKTSCWEISALSTSMPQPHAGAAAIGIKEFNASLFKGSLEFLERIEADSQSAIASFKPLDARKRNASLCGKLLLRPAEHGSGPAQLLSCRETHGV